MARRPKQAGIGDNTNPNEMTATERHALRMSHIRELLDIEEEMQPLREAKRKARAAAKMNGFKLTEIDAGIRILTMEDPAIFADELRMLVEIGRAFNALPPGGQGELFPDRRPKEERRFDEGRVAGMAGLSAEPPFNAESRDGQQWLAGHAEGVRVMQEELEAALNKMKAMRPEEPNENPEDIGADPFDPATEEGPGDPGEEPEPQEAAA